MTHHFFFKLFVITIATSIRQVHGYEKQGQTDSVVASTTRFHGFASLDLASQVNKYLLHETKRLDIIKSSKGYEEEVPILKTRLQTLKTLHQQLASRKAEFDSMRQTLSDFHPTSALRAVTDFLDAWEEKISNDTFYGFRFAEFLSNDGKNKLPRKSDLSDLTLAITDIQFIYNLSTSDIYHGKVMGQNGTPLLPKDAFEIGISCFNLSHLELAASWFRIALDNTPDAEMNGKTGNTSYPVPIAMAKLGILEYDMGEKEKGLNLLEQASNLDSDDGDILRQYLSHRYGRDVKPLVHSSHGELYKHWFRLCANASSAVLVPRKWYHVCRYRRSSTVPYRVYREEILSRSPFLSIIHSFLSTREIHKVVNVSVDKLHQPAVEGAESQLVKVEGTSLTHKVPIARVISDRTTDLTGMDTRERSVHSSGEPLHVINYGISGTFLPHQDIDRHYRSPYVMDYSGYRLASLLIYLSNVTAGGATAFPHLNITVTPQAGNAVLWYNASPDGVMENNIVHASCPVVVGAKWVASKGIWSWNNELRRPCGPKAQSSHMAVDKILSHLSATSVKS